jgi:FkbM family methyltransferase
MSISSADYGGRVLQGVRGALQFASPAAAMRWLDRLRAAVAPFAHGPATSLARFWREPEYRQHLALQVQLAGLPRHEAATVDCGGFRLELVDAPSFLAAHYDIFVEEIYRFPFAHDAPSVVDLGANVGLATLWFKRHYPRARIVALEPDPAIFACLERNVRANGLSDVELVNQAAWDADTELDFFPDGADGGHAAERDMSESGARRPVKVKALAIDRFLGARPIDFLKIDIEGAEDVVVAACRPLLPRVGCLFIEYHSRSATPSRLGAIVAALEEAGFRLHVENARRRTRPFCRADTQGAFDMQLNLFAWRAS